MVLSSHLLRIVVGVCCFVVVNFASLGDASFQLFSLRVLRVVGDSSSLAVPLPVLATVGPLFSPFSHCSRLSANWSLYNYLDFPLLVQIRWLFLISSIGLQGLFVGADLFGVFCFSLTTKVWWVSDPGLSEEVLLLAFQSLSS